MKFTLASLKKYNKRKAKKINNFKAFDPFNDSIIINTNLFNINNSPDVYIAGSKKDFKKSDKTNSEFIYHKKKGLLYYNENGDIKKFGKGGVIAIFPRRQNLDASVFKFKGFSVTPATTPEPLPTLSTALPPTDLLTSITIFEENIAPGSIVATLRSVDSNATDIHSYSLITGEGAVDNDAFEIIGNQIKIKEFQTLKPRVSIRFDFKQQILAACLKDNHYL